MKSIKKKHIIALVGLAALVLVGGVYAYWSQTSTVENPFDTGRYGSTIREDFDPSKGENWQPGVEIAKVVTAINKGDTDLIVRARLDEKWTRKANASANAGETYKYSTATSAPQGFPSGHDVYGPTLQGGGAAGPTDGLTAQDGTIVEKKFASSLATYWVKGTDGWYYYKTNLAGGKTSEPWLESVKMIDDADMGKFETKKYVSVYSGTSTDETTWVWVEYTGDMPKYLNGTGPSATPCQAADPGAQKVLHNKTETTYAKSGGVDLLGYSQSNYTLTVTVQTVQPTQDAINAMFGGGSAFTAPAGTSWVLKAN